MQYLLSHNTHNGNLQGVFPFLLVPQEMIDACLRAPSFLSSLAKMSHLHHQTEAQYIYMQNIVACSKHCSHTLCKLKRQLLLKLWVEFQYELNKSSNIFHYISL